VDLIAFDRYSAQGAPDAGQTGLHEARAGRLQVRALDENARVVPADRVLPRLAVVVPPDLAQDIVIRRAELQIDVLALAPGEVRPDTLGIRITLLVLDVDARSERDARQIAILQVLDALNAKST